MEAYKQKRSLNHNWYSYYRKSKIDIPAKAGIFSVFLFLFSLLTANAQITAEPDCINAICLTDSTVSTYFEVNGPGTIDDANGALIINCLNQMSVPQWESHSAWFSFTVNQTGELGFYIKPDLVENWNFALFGSNPDCSDLANPIYWKVCDTGNSVPPDSNGDEHTGVGAHPILGGNGSGVNAFQPYINVTAGETYVLFITPFFTPGRTATLTFQGDLIDTYGDIFDDPCCSLGINDLSFTNSVTIYPNPTTDILHIDSTATIHTVELYNMLGQRVLQQPFSNKINVSQLQNGVYFIKLYGEQNQVSIKRIVKQ